MGTFHPPFTEGERQVRIRLEPRLHRLHACSLWREDLLSAGLRFSCDPKDLEGVTLFVVAVPTPERIVKMVSGQDGPMLEWVAAAYGATIDAGIHCAPTIGGLH